MSRVVVLDWDSRWSEAFDQEAQVIRRLLGELVVDIQHVGSTAVSGLCAKPIIDIFVQVHSLVELDTTSSRLEDFGYEAMGAYGIPGRRFFRLGRDPVTHHIHIYQYDDSESLRHVEFRDYLRAHPKVAAEYGRLKRAAAVTHSNDRDQYQRVKSPSIDRWEAEARVWVSKGGGVRHQSEPMSAETIYGVPISRLGSDCD